VQLPTVFDSINDGRLDYLNFTGRWLGAEKRVLIVLIEIALSRKARHTRQQQLMSNFTAVLHYDIFTIFCRTENFGVIVERYVQLLPRSLQVIGDSGREGGAHVQAFVTNWTRG